MLRFALFPNHRFHQPDQLLGEGHQHHGCHNIEQGVQHSDVPGLYCLSQQISHSGDHGLRQHHDDQAENTADGVQRNVQKCHASGLGGGTDGGDQCGDTGTDVLTHDDGKCHAKGDAARQRQRLQNTHRSGRTLDQAGEQCTDEHAHHGIVEVNEQLSKLRHIGQRADGIAHHIHTEHQNGKTHENGAQRLLFVALGQHDEADADKGQNGREVDGLEHLHPEAGAFDTGQRSQPGRQCGADVGAEYHVNRLGKGHDARVDQTNQHNGNGRGRLDGDGNDRAQRQTEQGAGCHFAEHFLQLTTGHFFQTGRHDVHAVQEKGQAADHGDQIKDAHEAHSF